jgi:predicted MPP superfamily phosphohydrolase
MSDSFTWLHLTDLHYGLGGQDCLWPNLREPFLRDLEELHAISGPWNAVLFTGDLVQRGQSEEFVNLQSTFLDPLIDELNRLGSKDVKVLAVPGNHDLERPGKNLPNSDVMTNLMLRPDNFHTSQSDLWRQHAAWTPFIHERFKNYSSWWEALKFRPHQIKQGILPGDFATSLPWGDHSIGIVGLNTTFLQLTEGDFKEKLAWNVAQLHAICEGGVDTWSSKHIFCLLMTHHGPEWLTPGCRTHGENEITPEGRFMVHLFGHQHESGMTFVRFGGSAESIRRHQGVSLFGIKRENHTSPIKRSHGYAVTKVSWERDALLMQTWPRVAKDSNGWHFIPDHSLRLAGVSTKAERIAITNRSFRQVTTSHAKGINTESRAIAPVGASSSSQQFDNLSAFTMRLAQISPEATTSSVLPLLTKIWREESRSDWAWLWIYNRYLDCWDLVCHEHRPEYRVSEPTDLRVDLTSVSEFVAQSKQPVLIDSIENWQASLSDTTYRVASAKWLVENKCTAFVGIPLLTSHGVERDQQSQVSQHLQVRASICLHFSSADSARSFFNTVSESNLMTMGTLTALAIGASYNAERLSLLYQLNRLSSDHLIRFSKRPEKLRREYLAHLTNLIRSTLRVNGVTFFYRIPYLNAVECLYTTGLIDKNSNVVKPNSLSDVRYDRNEGRTGTCFWTASPVFVTRTDVANKSAKFIEASTQGALTDFPALMWPITSKTPDSSGMSILGPNLAADGVVRITERTNTDRTMHQRYLSFTPIEAEILAFIAEQVGPVLKAITIQLIREKQLALVKHDLDALSQSVQASAASIKESKDNDLSISDYALTDLEGAQILVKLLVAQIAPGALERITPKFTRTALLGDVIARNVALLQQYGKSSHYDPSAAVSKIRVEYRKEDFIYFPFLFVDKLLIERAFLNIAVNAVKYANPGTTVEVAPRFDSDAYCIEISNIGIGVDQRDAKNIFKPYFRGRNAKKHSQGVGLGLHIASQYIEAHGGRVELTRCGGDGSKTVFSIILPASLKKKPQT